MEQKVQKLQQRETHLACWEWSGASGGIGCRWVRSKQERHRCLYSPCQLEGQLTCSKREKPSLRLCSWRRRQTWRAQCRWRGRTILGGLSPRHQGQEKLRWEAVAMAACCSVTAGYVLTLVRGQDFAGPTNLWRGVGCFRGRATLPDTAYAGQGQFPGRTRIHFIHRNSGDPVIYPNWAAGKFPIAANTLFPYSLTLWKIRWNLTRVSSKFGFWD